MTPYTKKIVELHKIHKAIEEKDCCNGGGNTPSGDITIDDVVKFIHDEINNDSQFPYTKYNDIPDISSISGNINNEDLNLVKGSVQEINSFLDNADNNGLNIFKIFNTPNYVIANVYKITSPDIIPEIPITDPIIQ